MKTHTVVSLRSNFITLVVMLIILKSSNTLYHVIKVNPKADLAKHNNNP